MMKSEEYKKYLKRIKRNNILVLLTQILIVVIFIVFWQIMADKNMVDTFLVSSPKKGQDILLHVMERRMNCSARMRIISYHSLSAQNAGTLLKYRREVYTGSSLSSMTTM